MKKSRFISLNVLVLTFVSMLMNIQSVLAQPSCRSVLELLSDNISQDRTFTASGHADINSAGMQFSDRGEGIFTSGYIEIGFSFHMQDVSECRVKIDFVRIFLKNIPQSRIVLTEQENSRDVNGALGFVFANFEQTVYLEIDDRQDELGVEKYRTVIVTPTGGLRGRLSVPAISSLFDSILEELKGEENISYLPDIQADLELTLILNSNLGDVVQRAMKQHDDASQNGESVLTDEAEVRFRLRRTDEMNAYPESGPESTHDFVDSYLSANISEFEISSPSDSLKEDSAPEVTLPLYTRQIEKKRDGVGEDRLEKLYLCIQPVFIKGGDIDLSRRHLNARRREIEKLWGKVGIIVELADELIINPSKTNWTASGKWKNNPRSPISLLDVTNLRRISDIDKSFENNGCAEMIFVNSMDCESLQNTGGGRVPPARFGTVDTFLITTDLNYMLSGATPNNKDLAHLPHEVGHMLGVTHPGNGPSFRQGTKGTLMCHSGFRSDSPHRNSLRNRRKAIEFQSMLRLVSRSGERGYIGTPKGLCAGGSCGSCDPIVRRCLPN